MALAMEDGPSAWPTWRLLEKYARDYESSGYHGVSGFVRFLDKLRDSGSDLQAAELSPQDRDAVTVMSIHKSKGLEFPVCIVAGCGRNFVSDQRAEVLLHPRAGPGGQAAGPGALGPVYHHRPGGHRPGDSPCLRRGGAARPLRGADPRQGEAAAGGLLEDPERTAEKLALELTEAGPAPYTVRRPRTPPSGCCCAPCATPTAGTCAGLPGPRRAASFGRDYTPWIIHFSQYQPGRRPFPGSPGAPAPRLAAVPPPAAADCLCLPPPGGGGHPAKVAASKLAAEQDGSRDITLSGPPGWGSRA